MVKKLIKIAKSIKEDHPDLSEAIIKVAKIVERKKGPISRHNLLAKYECLTGMSKSKNEESRAFAINKLKELEPTFRKYIPEVFQQKLDI